MPTLASAASQVLAQLQASFVTSAAVPAQWQLIVGQEMAQDVDAFTDACCSGLGFALISNIALENGTQQLEDGSLYTRMTVVFGVLRCSPTIDDHLRSPMPAEHAAYAALVLDDAERILKAVWDVAGLPWVTEGDVSAPVWSAVPQEGGCGGGAATFEVAVIGDC
jgi:hypothetical protein